MADVSFAPLFGYINNTNIVDDGNMRSFRFHLFFAKNLMVWNNLAASNWKHTTQNNFSAQANLVSSDHRASNVLWTDFFFVSFFKILNSHLEFTSCVQKDMAYAPKTTKMRAIERKWFRFIFPFARHFNTNKINFNLLQYCCRMQKNLFRGPPYFGCSEKTNINFH